MVLAIHDRQLAEHGGLDGVRDAGAVESALARPQNLVAYGDPDAADLAAAYGYGLARNHGVADGNKRTAWVVARLFLADHGRTLRFDRGESVGVMEDVARLKVCTDWRERRNAKSLCGRYRRFR